MQGIGLFRYITDKIGSRYMTNRKVTITSVATDFASNKDNQGLSFLHAVFERMDDLVQAVKNDSLLQELAAMRLAVGDAVELAYRDWPTFCEQWEVDIYYYEHVRSSFIYVFYFKERNGHRQYHFRFAGL